MSYFAVIREAGREWDDGKPRTEQPLVNEHARFMEKLADDGFVLVAGPIGGNGGRFRALVVVRADDADDVHQRFVYDPWMRSGRLRTTSIEPWTIFLGGQRLEF